MIGKLLFLFLLFAPFSVFGQTEKSVVINEIAWMGSSVEGVEQNQWWRYEWLELHNPLDVPVGLDGWTVELSRDKPDFKVSLKGSIDPKGYFLAGASDKISNVDLNYKNLAGEFVNSGQKVVLKNNTGEIIDEVDATKGWPAGDNETKRTMERVAGSDPATWQTSENPGGTPKAQNSTGFPVQQKKASPQASSKPVVLKPSATTKDPDGNIHSLAEPSYLHLGSAEENNGSTRENKSSEDNPFFTVALPGALLAAALALGAKRFLLRQA